MRITLGSVDGGYFGVGRGGGGGCGGDVGDWGGDFGDGREDAVGTVI